MSVLQPQQTAGDPSLPLKKYVGERVLESVGAVHQLAHSLATNGPHAQVAQWSKKLNEKSDIIKVTGENLERMPVALASLDAALDTAVQRASLLPNVSMTRH